MEAPHTILDAAGRLLALLVRASVPGGALYEHDRRLARKIRLRAAHLRRLVERGQRLPEARAPQRQVAARPAARWLSEDGVSWVLGADGVLRIRQGRGGDYEVIAAHLGEGDVLDLLRRNGCPYRRIPCPGALADQGSARA